jgi:hypothetical protein
LDIAGPTTRRPAPTTWLLSTGWKTARLAPHRRGPGLSVGHRAADHTPPGTDDVSTTGCKRLGLIRVDEAPA